MQDSVNRIDTIIERVKSLGQTSWALTDHNTCTGIVDAYKKSKKAGLKLIPGAELYLTSELTIQQRDLTHITFWAKNKVGLENLYKLVSVAHGDRGKAPNNYYYKSRVDIELIAKYSEGLMVGSACLGGWLRKCIGTDEDDKKIYDVNEDTLQRLLKIFPDDLFIELHTYQCEEQYDFNRKIVEVAKKYSVPLIVATDAHFAVKSDADLRKYFKNTSKEQDDSENVDDTLYLQSEDDIRENLKYLSKDIVEQAIANTQLLSDKSNVEIEFGQKYYPHYPCADPVKEVRNQCRIGWNQKIKGKGLDYEVYKKRFIYEMEVLTKQGYCSYFLITAGYLNKCRAKGIPVGPGRGSVVASLVAYLMGITQLDPIKYNMTFERFAHSERLAPPDIDCDVSRKRRQEVIQDLADDYGFVYQVRTAMPLGAKSSTRRAGTALGWSQDDVDALIKTMAKYEPGDEDDDDLSTYEQKIWILDHVRNESNAELIDLAKRFVGIISGYGKHASAVIIMDSEITKFCSIERQTDSKTKKPCYIASCGFTLLEEMGLMKADVLGLKTLDVIHDTIELSGESIDINSIPRDDLKTSQMLCEGGTSGCFQIESPGMTHLVKQIKPQSFVDLIPLVALYRPGPLDAIVEETGDTMVQTYVKVRNGEIEATYLHPKLKPILQETYGIILYQEQILEIVKELCGYSLGEADVLRRIIGKKKIDQMKPAVDKMIERGVEQGIPRNIMAQISDRIVTFALYGFNKGHSGAYGLVSYQTAYLKTHYPLQFMCATINSEENNQEKIVPYIDECKRLGIEILPPDVRYSNDEWVIEQ
jgi:DNA polymerase-3 subunit alpha